MEGLFSLKSKSILITGASSGIGKQTAIELSEAGANVFLAGRNETRLRETLDLLTGDNHQIIAADLTDSQSINSLIDNLPILNGVVHSAGITSHLPAKFIGADDITATHGINFIAPVLLTSALLRRKKIEAGASMVFISSVAARYPYFGGSLYSSSKAALEAYSRTLALELAGKKIRCNCISPSFVETPMVEQAGETISNEVLEKFRQMLPLGFGKPSDVSHAILYLLSDAAAWVTGSTISLGGG